MPARVISVNVGRIASVAHGGQTIRTGFRKLPQDGRVRIGPDGLEGDEIADRRVHGGPSKAVYAYPQEHYAYWTPRLSTGGTLPWGSFGENLTVRGLSEERLRRGDRLSIGSSVLVVTQPRHPCYKLGLHHQRPELVREFENAERSGFYLSVERPGMIQRGDLIVELGGGDGATVLEMLRS